MVMDLERVNPIINALLYEGYLLYPYRASAIKNRQRFNFGTLFPPALAEASGSETSTLCAECLVTGARPQVEIRVRFLHLQRPMPSSQGAVQEAIEREVIVPAATLSEFSESRLLEFDFVAARDAPAEKIAGEVEIRPERLDDALWKLAVEVRNVTSCEHVGAGRDEALLWCFASTHLIFGVCGGEFVSLVDPPISLKEAAAACNQRGAWPVLVGDPAKRDMMLCGPIIIYDYPQVAPESGGDFFDATEIDELLSLRVMTLSDEEKQQMRRDVRTRRILDRVETASPQSHAGLHGTVRWLRCAFEEPE